MVQHDVMRLEVKKLRDTLNSRADEVFTLENRKFQLQMSMEERKREISVHKDIQRAQLKAVEEEKHRVSMELQERTMKVDKLKNKYETLVKLSSVGSEGDGDRSQAFYVIEAAMKREELQREGDELDAKIRKCEREIRALEQTLKHLTARNTNFRQSFQRADMGGDDAKNLKRLEEAVKQKKDELFKRKKELQHMQTDYEDDQRRLEKLSAQTSELQEYNKHLESAHGQVKQELEQQEDKLARAQARVKKLSLEHRAQSASDVEIPTLHEVVIKTEYVRETTRNVVFTLGQLSREFPEITDTLNGLLQEKNLAMPSRPPSRVTLRGQGGDANGYM